MNHFKRQAIAINKNKEKIKWKIQILIDKYEKEISELTTKFLSAEDSAAVTAKEMALEDVIFDLKKLL